MVLHRDSYLLKKIRELHGVRVSKAAGGRWKSASINNINMHDTVRLARKPKVEGEIRHIDKERKKVEFSWGGKPIVAKIGQLQVLVKEI
ncbi:hypothetical protein KY361_06320 [Candidatus Woesearchaeota archaeon]|nr:hypothetical protein [Candidatus Woesearchaeota archaeon]